MVTETGLRSFIAATSTWSQPVWSCVEGLGKENSRLWKSWYHLTERSLKELQFQCTQWVRDIFFPFMQGLGDMKQRTWGQSTKLSASSGVLSPQWNGREKYLLATFFFSDLFLCCSFLSHSYGFKNQSLQVWVYSMTRLHLLSCWNTACWSVCLSLFVESFGVLFFLKLVYYLEGSGERERMWSKGILLYD